LAKTWRFVSLLLVTPDLNLCIHDAHSSAASADVVKHHLLSQIILNSLHPDHIFNVAVRYELSDLDAACSKFSFEGYVQSDEKLEEYIL
jgi:ribonuclease BN (tRNA processing enzyme)